MAASRYIFLDRDGVINCDADDYIKSAEEWLPLEGSLEAIAMLNQHGYQVVIITNQSGIGRGYYDQQTLEQMHAKMRKLLAAKGGEIFSIYYCPHIPSDNCDCRKPKPGLLQRFSDENGNVSLAGLYFIGDSWSDVQAALAVAMKPLLVRTGKGLRTLAAHPEITIPVFENLYAAVQSLISTQNT